MSDQFTILELQEENKILRERLREKDSLIRTMYKQMQEMRRQIELTKEKQPHNVQGTEI